VSLAADRPEFAPPPQRGTPRAVALALVAHALLIAALTWGVNWRREAENDAVEAELWSSTVQQAAPRAVAPVPVPPAPTPTPAPPPPPPPPPPPQAVRPPEPTPAPKAPDIALEREKKQKELKEQKERELEQQAQQQKKLEAQKKAAQEKREAEARERAEDEAERKKEEQKKLAEQKRKEAEAAKQAEAAKKKDAETKQAAQAAADRAATLKRMQAMAGTGNENSTGTAARTSGPSGGYGARIAAAVRPNIVYPDAELVSGNPTAEFDVSLAPDGTIVGVKLRKSSGVPSWDDAAERGIRRTEKVPRDIDGRIFPALTVALQPKPR
jgi:colicin import membrane protein